MKNALSTFDLLESRISGGYANIVKSPLITMAAPEMDNEKFAITIQIGNKKETYITPTDAVSFLQSEIDNWAWLRDINEASSAGYELYNKYIFEQLKPTLDKIAQGQPNLEKLVINDLHYPFIESTSVTGELIRKVRHNHGDLTAAFLFIFMSPDTQTLIKLNQHVKNLIENEVFCFEKAIALKIATSFVNTEKLDIESKESAIENLYDKFTYKVAKTLKNLETKESETESFIKKIGDEHKTRADRAEAAFKRRTEGYRTLASKTSASARDSLQKAHQDLTSAKEAYHDKVDLDASVQYWNSRKTGHLVSKYIWLLVIVVFMGLTFAGLVTYYGYGGASGLSKSFHTEPNLVSIPAIPTDKKDTPTASSTILGHTSSELAIAVENLAGAALLITLFAVLIRISLRQFNTHSHFELDAAERVTFVKTYLALLNEGKLKSDDDRKVILESLFRSSQPGAVTETPFSSPIELVLKTLEKKP